MGNARHVGIRRSSVVVSLGSALAHSYSCFSLVSTPPPLPLIFCVFPMSFTSLLWSVPLYLASLGARCAKCWKRATVIDWVFLMPIVWGQDEWWGALELQFEGMLGSWLLGLIQLGSSGHTWAFVLLHLEDEVRREVFISLVRFIWASQWIVFQPAMECSRLTTVVLCGFVAFLIGPFTQAEWMRAWWLIISNTCIVCVSVTISIRWAACCAASVRMHYFNLLVHMKHAWNLLVVSSPYHRTNSGCSQPQCVPHFQNENTFLLF